MEELILPGGQTMRDRLLDDAEKGETKGFDDAALARKLDEHRRLQGLGLAAPGDHELEAATAKINALVLQLKALLDDEEELDLLVQAAAMGGAETFEANLGSIIAGLQSGLLTREQVRVIARTGGLSRAARRRRVKWERKQAKKNAGGA